MKIEVVQSSVNPLPGVPDVESPFFERIFANKKLDSWTLNLARQINQDGYALIDFPDEMLDARIDRIKNNLVPRLDVDAWRMNDWKRGRGLRIQDAWKFDEDVRAVAVNESILKLLGDLYGRRTIPFQTLNFPVGTQQLMHSDLPHFSSMPERFVAGVWVAFEDVDEENGTLAYVPGSHKLPVYANEHLGVNALATGNQKRHYHDFEKMWLDLIDATGLEVKTLHIKKGQALIWAANLLHAGTPHKNPARTRWSQVTHYYFEDCSYFTPMISDPTMGSIAFREVVDICTGKVVPHQYCGYPVPGDFVAASRARPLAPGDVPLPAGWDAQAYLAANPDVAAAGISADEHYRKFGVFERRRLR